VNDFLEYYNPPPTDLPYEDGEPLESNWHRAQSSLLLEVTRQSRHDRKDFFVGANMFIYYSAEQARESKATGGQSKYRGPDFFVVLNVDGSFDRHSWRVWDEHGRYPNVIIELLSTSTAEADKSTKKQLYAETFRTPNYFYYEPASQELSGFELAGTEYIPLTPNTRGWLWCGELGLWLGKWRGEYLGHLHTWLRFFTPEGELVLTGEEAGIQQTQAATLLAAAERQRAEAERQRAEAERQRAEMAETTLARLREQLQTLGIDPDTLASQSSPRKVA
jgi:Uma2 family endonuclease